MDGKRYISFLLILCFSIFLGHNLIPHHHHAESVNMAVNGECPIGHEDHNDEADQDADHHPIHCHAFNSIDMVKYSHSDTQQPVRVVSRMFIPVSIVKPEHTLSIDFKRYICMKIPDKSTRYFGAISMRAPPASA